MTNSIDAIGLTTKEKLKLTDVEEQIANSPFSETTTEAREAVTTYCQKELTRKYFNNYFNADRHFDTIYVSRMLAGKYFFTVDLSYNLGDIVHPKWAIRALKNGEITTIYSGTNVRLSDCVSWLENYLGVKL